MGLGERLKDQTRRAFDLAIGKKMPTALVRHTHTEARSVSFAQCQECLVHSGEMRRSVVCNAKQDPQQEGPDRQLSLTHTDRQQRLYATGDTGDRVVVQDLL
jgi:hypothetical protein